MRDNSTHDDPECAEVVRIEIDERNIKFLRWSTKKLMRELYKLGRMYRHEVYSPYGIPAIERQVTDISKIIVARDHATLARLQAIVDGDGSLV